MIFAKQIDWQLNFVFIHQYKNIECFDKNDVVTIVDVDKQDIQTLLNESSLLITDFSSVFFDFAYLRKPVIYFQFDESDYYQMHYDRGYFDYRKDGFGPVSVDFGSAVSSVKEMVLHSFELAENYLSKVNNTFAYSDKKNCLRVFKTINDLINK